MYSLAGMVAQRRYRPSSCRNYHASQDYTNAVDVMGHFASTDRELNVYLKWLQIRTEDVLLNVPEVWNRVQSVAGALLKKQFLSEKDLIALLTE